MKSYEKHWTTLWTNWTIWDGDRERERLWTNWGFQSGVKKSCIWQLFWSLLALCAERFILALGHVGSWQEAWKLFKRYDLNNDDVLSPPLPQDFEHRLIHFNGTWFEFIWIPHVSTGFAKSQAWVERASRDFAILLSISHWSHQHFDSFLSRYEFQLLLRHVLRERFPSAKDVPRELFKELWLKLQTYFYIFVQYIFAT